MEDNKLFAILIGASMVVAIVAIIAISAEKTPHEKRMEKIEELRELSELTTTVQRQQLIKDIDSMLHVVNKELETN